jgi:fluoroacetyl-CoA thioesterase
MVSSSTLIAAPTMTVEAASIVASGRRCERIEAGWRPTIADVTPTAHSEALGQDGSMQTGDQATLEFTVTDDDTAISLGSGDLPVLATPRLLAWCEAATCAAIEAEQTVERSSVGTRVQLDHTAPSAVGATVVVTASVVHADGRLVRFEVVARQPDEGGGELVVGHGEVTRVVVDRERFLSRLA